ncbi:hypothetical protein [Labilibaculum manganireducens]|uniref:hypothetical protein n=1 Tax=Labilibaculum manganireducens TaxID=1940525 RepID=UPI0029F54B83|nr:hypothetical protein [Labilibaculum manganireducens]
MGRNSRLFRISACIQECLYYFVGTARPICGELIRSGGLPAQNGEASPINKYG